MSKYLLLVFLGFSVNAAPIAHLTKTGEGEMNYLFWNLYLAELYQLPQGNVGDFQRNTALKITYYKSISSQALVEATSEQWQQLGYNPENIQRWLQPLQKIWPDVESGDQLTLLVTSEANSEFYYGDALIGKIKDPTFGQAFLSIWLSEQTSEPALRNQLLGLKQ